jgi:hypothetical protein
MEEIKTTNLFKNNYLKSKSRFKFRHQTHYICLNYQINKKMKIWQGKLLQQIQIK